MPEAAKLTPEEEKAIAAIQSAGKGPPAGGKEDAGALGSGLLGALDTATLGLAPALDDYLRSKGIIDEKTAPPSMRSQLAAGAELHPYANFAGRAGGMMLPFTGAAKLAQLGLGAAGVGTSGLVGNALVGAAGAGGADVADQAVRTQTEGREFSVPEAALSAGLGGGGAAIFHPIKGLAGLAGRTALQRVLGPAEQALTKELPGVADEAATAASKVFDEATAARAAVPKGRGGLGTLERPAPVERAGPPIEPPGPLKAPGPKPMEDLSTYAPDDPLAEVARMSRTSGVPHFEEPPGPIPPPRTPNFEGMGPYGPKPMPFQGVRPGKLERGSPMYEELSRRIGGGDPLPQPDPAALPPEPPPPPGPPGLLDLPLKKLGLSAGATSGEDIRKNRIVEEQKRRKKRRY